MTSKKILLAAALLISATSASLAQDYYGYARPYGYGWNNYGWNNYGWNNYGWNGNGYDAYSSMNSHQLNRDLGHSRGFTAESQR